ncbi:MAG: hypothetical protein KDA61_00335 [Planctomycetales bacterium]|nr:hypothetical protein [Planctomycetales bacterium]
MSTVDYNFDIEGVRCPGPPHSLPVETKSLPVDATSLPTESAPSPADATTASQHATNIPAKSALSHSPNSDGASQRRLNRVAAVRRQQGVSTRSITRKLGLSAQQIRQQENAACDLTISQLLMWQQALDVPIADLIVEGEGPLSEPISLRARLLRVMKTVRAIQGSAHDKGVQRMATMLADQLVDIMPELSDVSPWHSVGQRRTQDEMGRIAERTIPDGFFGEPR